MCKLVASSSAMPCKTSLSSSRAHSSRPHRCQNQPLHQPQQRQPRKRAHPRAPTVAARGSRPVAKAEGAPQSHGHRLPRRRVLCSLLSLPLSASRPQALPHSRVKLQSKMQQPQMRRQLCLRRLSKRWQQS